MSIAVAQAAFAHILRALALQLGDEERSHLLPVMGVDVVDPVAPRQRRRCIEGVAQDLRPTCVDEGFAGLAVPLPGACACSLQDVAQSTALVLQILGLLGDPSFQVGVERCESPLVALLQAPVE